MMLLFRRGLPVALGLWVLLEGTCRSGETATGFRTNGAVVPRFKIPKADVEGFRTPRPDPSEIAIGERLFLETRFAQFFFAQSGGDANASMKEGDPVVKTSAVAGAPPFAGPFAGYAINCRACHLVAEHRAAGRGNRSYADFASRSPVPARPDGRTVNPRNSQPMVNASIPREQDFFLHFDGEFTSLESLIKATLTGRNFGWLPDEQGQAARHIVHIMREDDGHGPLAREFGGHSYARVLEGTDEALGEEGERFRLPEEYRLDLRKAGDPQILDAIARLIGAYADSLFFSRDETRQYDGSPYDAFLETNQISRRVDAGMEADYYNRHLSNLANGLKDPVWVAGTNGVAPPAPGRFKTLRQEFRFGPQELAGMRIFFARSRELARTGRTVSRGVGNCALCHQAPDFTDFKFHNTGATQEEYDGVHGDGAFARLDIPELDRRNAHFDEFLPPTAQHPRASGPFLDIPALPKPGRTDLGLWNVFGNPDQPASQMALRAFLAGDDQGVSDASLLPRAIAMFKTPGLRGLSFSDPYLHSGSRKSLEEVIGFYVRMSALARAGKLRNAAPELKGMILVEEDIAPLAAFLRALNEDYE